MRCLEGHPRLLHVGQHRSFFARSRRLGFACFDRGLHAQVHRPFERSGEASGIDRRSCRVIALCGLIGGPDADDDLNALWQTAAQPLNEIAQMRRTAIDVEKRDAHDRYVGSVQRLDFLT